MVVVTFNFSKPSTSTFGMEVLTVKLGVAKAATAEATRATRAAWIEGEDIVMQAADGLTRLRPE